MKVAVIGRGLFGSAAARHLAMAGVDVTLIGPDEPVDKRAHGGVFGSHHDEGRITRRCALDPFWVGLSAASIARYGRIEADSGIRFYTQAGAMMAGDAAWMTRLRDACAAHGVEPEWLSPRELREGFSFFHLPDGFSASYEATMAGHISPRRLVAAQGAAALRHGAKIIDATVHGLDEGQGGVTVTTHAGTLRFDRVLVAAGAMTDSLLSRPPRNDVYARTVALFEVDAAEAARLSKMPALIWQAPEDPYLLPPIRYPDGTIHVKLGGDPEDVKLPDAGAIGDWFRAGGNPDVRDRLEQMIRALMPDLAIRAVRMDACVTTWSPDRRPEIGHLTRRVALCTAGNGAGAKCSDEIGRLGAALVLEQTGVST
ncbi:NAD(P)/FAD-dependent oxidoreductase [Oceaniglobus trochenteri]|uniref:NAD(P)/FAD-dependent oxidoreductase n=1 Tax=Oceaniglobus trochenteri TaxID=2763260 RepID=UPI001CFF9ACD|nr:FAD-dependent oxidoreductase [Oceaniglobus trochenteri]